MVDAEYGCGDSQCCCQAQHLLSLPGTTHSCNAYQGHWAKQGHFDQESDVQRRKMTNLLFWDPLGGYQ